MQAEDGTPTQDPPVYEIVSGNHRVYSAKEAGLTEIDCIVILNWISEQRRVEVQLSHNAVTGQDDLSILEKLYEGLTLSGKEYSGLTDELFKGLSSLSLNGFNVGGPAYQEITLSFLPGDAAQFLEMLKRFDKPKAGLVLLAQLALFDRLFDTLVRTKEQLNIQNTAVALFSMTELAIQRLDQLAEESQENPDDRHLVEPAA